MKIKNILTVIKITVFIFCFVAQAQLKPKLYPNVKDLKPLPRISKLVPNLDKQTFYIESAVGNKNRFLRASSNPNINSPMDISVFTAGKELQFTFKNAGDGYYYIQSNTQRRGAIYVYDSVKNKKAIVSLGNIANQDNFKWELIDAGDGYYFIKSKLGTFLDVQWGKDAIGTTIWMWTGPAKNGLAQKWKLNSIKHPITFNREFYPKLIKNLCPTKLIRGDREFGGNGPRVTGSVYLVTNRNMLQAQIKFSAKETKADWSHVTGEWTKTLFSLPINWKVNKILSPHDNTYFDYTTSAIPSQGYQFVDNGFRQGTLGIQKNGIAKRIRFVGDTGGNDISDNNECSDDTRIVFIEIKSINLSITYTP